MIHAPNAQLTAETWTTPPPFKVYSFIPVIVRSPTPNYHLFAAFLGIVRNMVDPVCPRNQRFWSKEQCVVPLESDVFALEYLASFDYNVDKALFSLYCEMGRGKG
jgi:hypothetical protein